MEPTIYKPSIYKGAGIYKTGDNGGGGGGGGGETVNIGGKDYTIKQMPDGKYWICENLDFAFCEIRPPTSIMDAFACYYDNDEERYGWNGLKLGLMYSGDAVDYLMANKSSLTPGYHVATLSEWYNLASAANGGKNLKDEKQLGWNGFNLYGLSVLPAGVADTSTFSSLGTYTGYWNQSSGDEFFFLQALENCIGDFSRSRNYRRYIRLVKD